MVFEKWPAGWADGEDEEGENNKIVQRKDHRVYSTEHLAHQKHLKTFHSSSFSKTWRKKEDIFGLSAETGYYHEYSEKDAILTENESHFAC